MTDDDQLQADRDRLADSLFALRHRIAAVIREPSTPDPERRRLVSLLSGVEMRDATEAGEERQGRVGQHQDAEGRGEADQAGGGNRPQAGREEAAEEVTIHYDPATHLLRRAGIAWGRPVVFYDDQYETND